MGLLLGVILGVIVVGIVLAACFVILRRRRAAHKRHRSRGAPMAEQATRRHTTLMMSPLAGMSPSPHVPGAAPSIAARQAREKVIQRKQASTLNGQRRALPGMDGGIKKEFAMRSVQRKHTQHHMAAVSEDGVPDGLAALRQFKSSGSVRGKRPPTSGAQKSASAKRALLPRARTGNVRTLEVKRGKLRAAS